jgi:undecaprenyl-diphosphatase
MNLLEQILTWDRNLFLFLNGLNSSFFDGFMWLVSSKIIYVPVLLAILIVILKDKRREFLFILLGLILTIVLCDQISGLFKSGFERWRPSREPMLEGLVHTVNGYLGGKYGFVSAHAANSFGFALFSSLIFRFKPYTIVIFSWALINAYSRIYLGVHYPLDIICGAILGIICALLLYLLLSYVKKFYTGFSSKIKMPQGTTSSGVSYQSLWIVIGLIFLTFFYIAVFAIEIRNFVL